MFYNKPFGERKKKRKMKHGKTEKALWNRRSVRINKEGRKERLQFREMESIGLPVRKGMVYVLESW